VPMAVLIEELFEFVDDVLDELGSRAALEPIRGIFRNGTGAERQLRVYKETGDLHSVVHHIVAETREGVSLPASSAAGAPQTT
jgi:carboxylate-amine ligase